MLCGRHKYIQSTRLKKYILRMFKVNEKTRYLLLLTEPLTHFVMNLNHVRVYVNIHVLHVCIIMYV